MEPAIEIEIEDPESVKIGMGGLEIILEPGKDDDDFNANLAEKIDDGVLATIADELTSAYEEDVNSRKWNGFERVPVGSDRCIHRC